MTTVDLYTTLNRMLRKALIILLVGSWILFSAVDLLEDLDFGAYPKIHASGHYAFGRTAQSANNIVENGTSHIATAVADLITPAARANTRLRPGEKEKKTPKKDLKIYKLHSAFLI